MQRQALGRMVVAVGHAPALPLPFVCRGSGGGGQGWRRAGGGWRRAGGSFMTPASAPRDKKVEEGVVGKARRWCRAAGCTHCIVKGVSRHCPKPRNAKGHHADKVEACGGGSRTRYDKHQAPPSPYCRLLASLSCAHEARCPIFTPLSHLPPLCPPPLRTQALVSPTRGRQPTKHRKRPGDVWRGGRARGRQHEHWRCGGAEKI